MNIVESDPVALALSRCSALPVEAIETLFARCGRPFAGDVPTVDPLVLFADGVRRVGRFRYRAPVDVIANDYFILTRARRESSTMPGPLFAVATAPLSRKKSA